LLTKRHVINENTYIKTAFSKILSYYLSSFFSYCAQKRFSQANIIICETELVILPGNI